jgi:pSer/pThr/pTyr-binding forkhead associated (FHA) protein
VTPVPPPPETVTPVELPVAVLVVTNGARAGERVIVEAQLVLGRENADVLLVDDQISRNHARVRPVPGGLEIEDLGSLNGTWVNGSRIATPTLVTRGDAVRLGGVMLEVE